MRVWTVALAVGCATGGRPSALDAPTRDDVSNVPLAGWLVQDCPWTGAKEDALGVGVDVDLPAGASWTILACSGDVCTQAEWSASVTEGRTLLRVACGNAARDRIEVRWSAL